jgi:hypothetical protein
METIWLNDWEDSDKAKLEDLFGLHTHELSNINLLLASYKQGDESGYGFIFFQIAEGYYEVNVSHDSENDLNGQWLPEETTIEALLFRLNRGNLGTETAGENVFAAPLRTLLNRLVQ